MEPRVGLLVTGTRRCFVNWSKGCLRLQAHNDCVVCRRIVVLGAPSNAYFIDMADQTRYYVLRNCQLSTVACQLIANISGYHNSYWKPVPGWSWCRATSGGGTRDRMVGCGQFLVRSSQESNRGMPHAG